MKISDDPGKENDRLRTENELLRRRMSAFGSAILRVGASLDPDTVLREIVDNACALTGARYGVIATTDASGQPRDFLTSGFTAHEQGQLLQWPDGPGFFERLRDLPGPLRLPDLPAWILSLGRSPFPIPCGSFQATPMRHGDVYAGGFFLGGRTAGSRTRTRRRWSCSPLRQRRRSPTHARTATSEGRGPSWMR